jgi:hypothetical protein
MIRIGGTSLEDWKNWIFSIVLGTFYSHLHFSICLHVWLFHFKHCKVNSPCLLLFLSLVLGVVWVLSSSLAVPKQERRVCFTPLPWLGAFSVYYFLGIKSKPHYNLPGSVCLCITEGVTFPWLQTEKKNSVRVSRNNSSYSDGKERLLRRLAYIVKLRMSYSVE